jgi:hypothetical protein
MIMVTAREQDVARRWLARRGQLVGRPTPLIATRLPFEGRRFWRYLVYAVVAVAAARLYSLPFWHGTTESATVYFVYFALGLSSATAFACGSGSSERTCRRRTRRIRGGECWAAGTSRLSCSLSPVGAGLAGTMYFATPARTYAVSWLGLLVLSALYVGWVLAGVLRRPLAAEDAASLAVARAMRTDQVAAGTPVLAFFRWCRTCCWGTISRRRSRRGWSATSRRSWSSRWSAAS